MASLRTLCTCALFLAACGGGGGFPDAKVIDSPPAGGRFSLAWTVSDAHGATATCDQIGGASVSISYHDPKVSGGGAEAFTCQTLTGTSGLIPVGTYDMTVTLVDLTGVTLATLPAQHGIVITSGETTALAAAPFSVDATGNLKLHVTALQAAGNCAAKAAGGAGITATTITLEHTADGSCAPVTFAIGAGSNQGSGSYTVNCTTPTSAGCIEADQELDAPGIDSGNYQIHIQGNNGSGTSCWTNNDTLKVPSTGRELNSTLNLGATGGSGC